MAKKTAIRITNDQVNLADAKALDRLDSIPTGDAAPKSTLQVLRAIRGAMSEAELSKLCSDAARAELGSWDSEDRRDCASEIMWRSLAENNGCPPAKDSNHGNLYYFRGLAKNYRKAEMRRRGKLQAEIVERDTAYADSGEALIYAATDHHGPLAVNEDGSWQQELSERELVLAESRTAAAAADLTARRAAKRIGLKAAYPVLYQWAREADQLACAHENDVSLDGWKGRVKRGSAAISERYPDPADFQRAVCGLAGNRPIRATKDRLPGRPLVGRRERPMLFSVDEPGQPRPANGPWAGHGWAEASEYWQLPAEREASEPTVHHEEPCPVLADDNRRLARDGYYVAAPGLRRSAPTNERGEQAKPGQVWKPGRTAEQRKADSRRAIARAYALERKGKSERPVHGQRAATIPKGEQ